MHYFFPFFWPPSPLEHSHYSLQMKNEIGTSLRKLAAAQRG